jgi:PPM family protein phosphatase
MDVPREHTARYGVLDTGAVDGSLVRPYQVGDSMILLTSNRGNVKFQTVSHSPMGYAVESGLLDAQEAIFHEHRHVVSNVIGCSNMRIEIGPGLQMAPRDTLLLASDGLFDNLHLDEIVGAIRKGDLSVAAKKLVDDAQQRMAHPADGHPSKPDDLTFILFRLPPATRKRNRSAADAKPAKLSAESSPKT